MSQAVYLNTMPIKRGGKVYEYWILQFRDAHGKLHSKSIGSTKKLSKRQAEKLRREKEYEFTKRPGRRHGSRAPTLSEYIQTYLNHRRSELKPGTWELHRHTGNYLLSFFGAERRLNMIHRADARSFKAALAAGELQEKAGGHKKILAKWTIHQHMRNSHKLFADAVEDELIEYNPFDKLSGKTPGKKGFHEVTDDEFSKLMDTASPLWQIWLALCFYAGLRRGEALTLRWEQIDWQRSRMTVIASGQWEPKDTDYRVVPIIPELRSILLQAFENAPDGAEYIIGPDTVDARGSKKPFDRLCKRVGVQPWSRPFHTLRKTRATRWAREFPQHVVSAWLGHSSITTTDRYYLQVSEIEFDRAAGLDREKSEAFV